MKWWNKLGILMMIAPVVVLFGWVIIQSITVVGPALSIMVGWVLLAFWLIVWRNES